MTRDSVPVGGSLCRTSMRRVGLVVGSVVLSACTGASSHAARVHADPTNVSSGPPQPSPGLREGTPPGNPAAPTQAHTAGPAQDVTTHCGGSTLHLTLGDGTGAAGGEYPLLVSIRNAGPGVCYLDGYPSLRLLDTQRQVLPFLISHGGNQTVTNGRPRPVVLRVNATGYFQFSAYRCDKGVRPLVAAAQVGLPGQRDRITLSLNHLSGIVGYCGSGDPGSTIAVSPVEGNESGTARHV